MTTRPYGEEAISGLSEPLMNDKENLNRLKQHIRELEEERSRLLASCDELQKSHDTLLEAIGVANQKQVAAEMLSMELEQVFSSCADAMWVVRKDKTVVRANEAMLELLGKKREEVVGRICHDLLQAPFCNGNSCPLGQSCGKDTGNDFDLERSKPFGNPQHFIVTAAPLVTLDGTPGIVTQFKDITDRKAAEAALAKANVALARMARLDSLTQLPNRRSFDETLEQEWRRLAREEQNLSLVLCDIDCFKQYNDTYGHQAGDDCLRQVAQALQDCVRRAGDMACRYGGEEFVFLLPNTHLEGAALFADRVRQTVEGLALPHNASQAANVVTLSLGVAAGVPCANGPASLIKSADEALYRAKEAGRNRVVAA